MGNKVIDNNYNLPGTNETEEGHRTRTKQEIFEKAKFRKEEI